MNQIESEIVKGAVSFAGLAGGMLGLLGGMHLWDSARREGASREASVCFLFLTPVACGGVTALMTLLIEFAR